MYLVYQCSYAHPPFLLTDNLMRLSSHSWKTEEVLVILFRHCTLALIFTSSCSFNSSKYPNDNIRWVCGDILLIVRICLWSLVRLPKIFSTFNVVLQYFMSRSRTKQWENWSPTQVLQDSRLSRQVTMTTKDLLFALFIRSFIFPIKYLCWARYDHHSMHRIIECLWK